MFSARGLQGIACMLKLPQEQISYPLRCRRSPADVSNDYGDAPCKRYT
jgi:hypothetical protein